MKLSKMIKEFRTDGLIDAKGNLMIYGKGQLDHFVKQHPKHKVVITINVFGDSPKEQIIGYYRAYVLPEFRRSIAKNGEYLTLEKTEEFITSICPVLQDEHWSDEGKCWVPGIKKFEDLDIYEAVACLNHLKEIAAVEYGFEIKDEGFG